MNIFGIRGESAGGCSVVGCSWLVYCKANKYCGSTQALALKFVEDEKERAEQVTYRALISPMEISARVQYLSTRLLMSLISFKIR